MFRLVQSDVFCSTVCSRRRGFFRLLGNVVVFRFTIRGRVKVVIRLLRSVVVFVFRSTVCGRVEIVSHLLGSRKET